MEFVEFAEAWPSLARRGITETRDAAAPGSLAIDPTKSPTSLELGPGARGERAIDATVERAAAAFETICHKLHLTPLHVIPFGTWRPVFDVVSFGLAKNAQWQKIDSQASVELNTRDALVFEQRNLHTLRDLASTLLTDGESTSAGVSVVATGQTMVAHLVPKHPIRITFASPQVADQARDAAQHFLSA
ncbi:MAG: hypothetical protein JNM94_02190 [Phycisphaerae bacterium]|nr:hypothetical protein [Phycisphaerae bacterium]